MPKRGLPLPDQEKLKENMLIRVIFLRRRALWIQRINAAARLEDLSYSKLMGLIHKAGIEINRKVLADLAVNNPAAFKAIVEKVKNA